MALRDKDFSRLGVRTGTTGSTGSAGGGDVSALLDGNLAAELAGAKLGAGSQAAERNVLAELIGQLPSQGVLATSQGLSQLVATTAADAPKIGKDTFRAKSEVEATIEHIAPVSKAFDQAKLGVFLLRDTMGRKLPPGGSTGGDQEDEEEVDPAEAPEHSVLRQLAEFVAKYKDDPDLKVLLAKILELDGNGAARVKKFRWSRMPRLPVEQAETGGAAGGEAGGEAGAKPNYHALLFQAGAASLTDTRKLEQIRDALVHLRARKQRALKRCRDAQDDLLAQIADARERLYALDRKRVEVLDDYAVAQQLVNEEYERVDRDYEARSRDLAQASGLYYVLVREAAVGRALPDPLPLRTGSASDPVPGLALDDQELAPELEPFMDTVLDIPIADWARLSPMVKYLPGRSWVARSESQRKARLTVKARMQAQAPATGVVLQRLTRLYSDNRALLHDFQAVTLAHHASLTAHLTAGARAVSLEDLVSGPYNAMSAPARTLHAQLSGAAAAILRLVLEVRPSIRLDWARLAERDALAVEDVRRWPGLARAEGDDFNHIRTLVELIDWWFRQLSAEAERTSRSAMRNFVRASLLSASHDDPDQILHGRVLTAPPLVKLGGLVRVQLNREARPGTVLKVLDRNQRVVAKMRLDDQDGEGAVATITQMVATQTTWSTGFSVIGQVLRRG